MSTPTLEDAVKVLAANPNPMDLVRELGVLAFGMADCASRLRNLEFGYLERLAELDAAKMKIADYETRLASVEQDRNDYKARVDAVEKLPADTARKVEELEKRTRTIEGAVGSSNFKPPAASPTDPSLSQRLGFSPSPAPEFSPIPNSSVGFSNPSPTPEPRRPDLTPAPA